jgi:hypothetical protein
VGVLLPPRLLRLLRHQAGLTRRVQDWVSEPLNQAAPQSPTCTDAQDWGGEGLEGGKVWERIQERGSHMPGNNNYCRARVHGHF